VLRLNAKVKPLRCASKLKLLRLYVWSENAYRRKLRRLYVESVSVIMESLNDVWLKLA
jgi:hypothetical protein